MEVMKLGMHHIDKLATRIEARGIFSRSYVSTRGSEEASHLTCTLRQQKDHKRVASFRVRSMPGCCGIALLHSFYCAEGKERILAKFIASAVRAAKDCGYGLVVLTLRVDSLLFTLLQSNWTVETFRNGKTDNMVGLLSKNLQQQPKPERPEDPNDEY